MKVTAKIYIVVRQYYDLPDEILYWFYDEDEAEE
jgi:hypothetical protein